MKGFTYRYTFMERNKGCQPLHYCPHCGDDLRKPVGEGGGVFVEVDLPPGSDGMMTRLGDDGRVLDPEHRLERAISYLVCCGGCGRALSKLPGVVVTRTPNHI